MDNPKEPEKMYGAVKVAQLWNKSPRTISRWVKKGIFPKPDKYVASSPLWKESTLVQFQNESDMVG